MSCTVLHCTHCFQVRSNFYPSDLSVPTCPPPSFSISGVNFGWLTMFLLGPEWQGVNWWTSLEGLMVQFPFKKDNPGPASQFCCAMVSFREFLSHIFTRT